MMFTIKSPCVSLFENIPLIQVYLNQECAFYIKTINNNLCVYNVNYVLCVIINNLCLFFIVTLSETSSIIYFYLSNILNSDILTIIKHNYFFLYCVIQFIINNLYILHYLYYIKKFV